MIPTTFVGNSSWASELRDAIRQVAGYRASVLVAGPSGTGKELIARAIHDESPRAERPFVAIDCTSIPRGLFASQLFGHVKGAFSGADCDTLGCFRAADGGTIFLDEIGELDSELQAQLLRVIQQRTVTPVGSHSPVPVDVRIVAATNRDLAAEVKAGRFRQDLYYRLNVVKLQTAPLAARREDVEPLCEHFLAKLAIENGLASKRLTRDALDVLRGAEWPGNVRELENTLERLVVFTPGEVIDGAQVRKFLEPENASLAESGGHLEESHEARAAEPTRFFYSADDDLPTLAEGESRLIVAALEQSFFNQSAAARLLGIDRKRLARKIREYGIEMPPARSQASR